MVDARRSSLQRDIGEKIEACVVACEQACKSVEDPRVSKAAQDLINKEGVLVTSSQCISSASRRVFQANEANRSADARVSELAKLQATLLSALESLEKAAKT